MMEADDGYEPTTKEKLASILPQVAAIISMLGSYIVIREVLVDHRQRKGKAIPRILLEMCIADLIFSSGWFLATWPSPSDVENLWYNVGNIATCNLQGFMLQFGLTASPLFNILLATFYLLMVRYSWTDARLQKVEWWVHGGVWIFSLACSIFPIFLGLYNNAWTVCWFESVPAGCKDSYRYGDEATCVRGDNAWIYAVAFTAFPVLTCVVLSFVIMWMIYSYVRKTERRMSRYAGSKSRFATMAAKMSNHANTAIVSGSRHGKKLLGQFGRPKTPGASIPPTAGVEQDQVESSVRPTYHHSETSATEGSIASNLPVPTHGKCLRRAGTSMGSTATTTSSRRSLGNSTSRSQVVARQGIFYILSFVATYALHCFCTLVFFTTGKYWYWLHLSMYFFLSLQGFFNALVFTRGRHMKTPEGRIFQKIVFCKCKVRKKLSARWRTPTDTTFQHSSELPPHSSELVAGAPDEANMDTAAPPASLIASGSIHDDDCHEDTELTRRVSFMCQELPHPEELESESFHEDDGDEENLEDTTRRVSLVNPEPTVHSASESIKSDNDEVAISQESESASESIHDERGNDVDEENTDTTRPVTLTKQEFSTPEESETVHDDDSFNQEPTAPNEPEQGSP